MTVDVLLPKFRRLWSHRMLHTAYMLSLAGYLQSPVITDPTGPFHTFMDSALICGSDYLSLLGSNAMLAVPTFTCR